MKISVIGLGYLGAVTAASFASLGHKVIAIDRDENKINEFIEPFGGIHAPLLPSTNYQDSWIDYSNLKVYPSNCIHHSNIHWHILSHQSGSGLNKNPIN